MAEFLRLIFSGETVGAIYALVGLGFSIICNASQEINFAQGEFVMIDWPHHRGPRGRRHPAPARRRHELRMAPIT